MHLPSSTGCNVSQLRSSPFTPTPPWDSKVLEKQASHISCCKQCQFPVKEQRLFDQKGAIDSSNKKMHVTDRQQEARYLFTRTAISRQNNFHLIVAVMVKTQDEPHAACGSFSNLAPQRTFVERVCRCRLSRASHTHD